MTRHKKILIYVLLAGVILTSFFAKPESANALACAQIIGTSVVQCVITVPGSVTTTNPPGANFLSMDWIQKWIINPSARIIIRALLQATTQQIVSWINNDGGKNVGYVKNLEQALRREADLEGGRFLNNLSGINLCGNLRAYLNITLRLPPLQQRLGCSVTDIVRNVENFYRDFQQGGWPAFIRISLEPQNNPYGAYMIALDAKIQAESIKQEQVKLASVTGRGYLGFRVPVEKCEIITIDELPDSPVPEQEEGDILPDAEGGGPSSIPGGGRQRICKNEYETKTPGSLIADGLSKATFGGLDFAWSAKEFDEAISVIINALINKLISSTFAGSDSGSSGEGVFDPGFNNLPREDLTESVIAKRINDGLFTADAALALADEKLVADRKALFEARKKLDELLRADPSGTSVEVQRLKQKISELQTAIPPTLEIKRKILFSQYDLLLLKRSLAAAPTPSEIQRIAQDLPTILLRLANAISPLGALPTAAISTGSNKRDLLESLRGTKDNLTNALTLVDDTGKEIERVLAGSIDPAKRQELTIARTALLTQRGILQGQLDSVTNMERDVARTDNPDRIKNLTNDLVKQLFTINQAIEQAGDNLTKIDALIKTP